MGSNLTDALGALPADRVRTFAGRAAYLSERPLVHAPAERRSKLLANNGCTPSSSRPSSGLLATGTEAYLTGICEGVAGSGARGLGGRGQEREGARIGDGRLVRAC